MVEIELSYSKVVKILSNKLDYSGKLAKLNLCSTFPYFRLSFIQNRLFESK